MNDICPKCGCDLAWREYRNIPGTIVEAKCLKLELEEYNNLRTDIEPCDWQGHLERQKDGSMKIVTILKAFITCPQCHGPNCFQTHNSEVCDDCGYTYYYKSLH